MEQTIDYDPFINDILSKMKEIKKLYTFVNEHFSGEVALVLLENLENEYNSLKNEVIASANETIAIQNEDDNETVSG